jgi:hypothetical protein
MASGAIETSREDSDDFEYVLHELLFKRRRISLCYADDLNVLLLADLEDQLRAKAQQTILMRQHKTLHLPSQQEMKKMF